MTRVLALGLLLALPAPAQQAPTQLPFRGNLRVRTAISIDQQHQWAQKIFPTLESGLFRVEGTRLDWVGLADRGYQLSPDGWLAYRGAAAAFTEARPQLTAVPGFEWLEVPPLPEDPPRSLCIYGADHVAPGWSFAPSWPALRVGRLVPDLSDQELRGIYDRSLYPQLRRGRILTLFDDLYYESLGADLVNTGGIYNSNPVDLGNLAALEKPGFYGTTLYSNDPNNLLSFSGLPPTESIWGPPSADLKGALNLDRGTAIAQQLQDPPGLTRMGNTALEVEMRPDAASYYLPILTNRLRWGEPLSNNGWLERLPLTPGWRPDKVPEAARDNPQYQKMYGQYFTLLEGGLNLFQSYGGGLSRSGLETARYAWAQGTGSQHLADLPPAQLRTWEQIVDWLQQYDDRQTLVAQLDAPDLTSPAAWLRYLDPRKLRGKPLARQRFGLVEVAYGQSSGDFASTGPAGGGGPIPGASPLVTGLAPAGGRLQYDYYNLALRNGWRVAPCSGIDNLGPLDRRQGKLVPAVRGTFTGMYPGPADTVVGSGQANFSSNGPERIRQMLAGLAQRRTFVSENPYVDALLYARDVQTGRLIPMGGELFQGFTSSATTFELTLQLSMPVRTQVTAGARIKMEEIKLVEVSEREREMDDGGRRLKIAEATRNPQVKLGPRLWSTLVTDETPVFKNYTSGAVAQPGTSAGVGAILQNYGLTGAQLNPPDPESYPLPVTLTWRVTARPHQAGGTVAYYVKANLPAMGALPAGSLVTAPLWTVSDWNRFASIDEAQ